MDDLIESVLHALDDDSDRTLSKLVQFRLVPSNSEKVQVIQELLDDWSIERPATPTPSVKCNQKAAEFLCSGDKWLARKTNNFDALLNYNESIAFAENGSQQLALGYARRSAVYARWQLHDLCLENIRLARSVKDGCPESAVNELEELERNSILSLNGTSNVAKEDNEAFVPKLSFPPHKKVPFIADCLDIRENEQYGRYIITHQPLVPGQVLAVEDKYLNILLPSLRHQRCAHCLSENSLCLIPCPGCTSTMFCSKRCLNIAQHTYHPFECPIMDYLHLNFDRFHLSALRATIMAFISLRTVERVGRVVSEGDHVKPVTVFDVNHRKRSVAQKYLQIHTFPTKQHLRTVPDLISTAVVVAALSRHLLINTKFCELVSDQQGRTILNEMLFRHLQISRMYFHSLSSADKQYRSDQGGLRGTGVFPFCSLVNHACTPNVVRVPFGTKMVMFVLRPIAAGEQLFDNYGSHHYSESMSDRQESMLTNYLFKCECDACNGHFAKSSALESKDLPAPISETDRVELAAGNRRYAAENWQRFAEYLAAHDASYPCWELNLAQQHYRESLHIMAGNISVRLQHQ